MADDTKTSDPYRTEAALAERAPKKVSVWEIGGIPAAGVFAAAYHLGWLSALGIAEDQVPDLMLMTYVVAALVRALGTKVIQAIAVARARKG